MDKINTKPGMNFKAMTAVLTADPDGLAILGAWNCMELLAREDPEGCVRLDPGQPMDIPMLAGLFHCAVNIVEKAVDMFRNMNRLTVKDGVIRIRSCVTGKRLDAGDDADVVRTDVAALQTDAVRADTARTDADAERERLNLLNRLRVRRFRAKKKREKMMAAGNGAVTDVMADVTQPVMNVMADVMDGGEKRKNQRKENIYNNPFNNPEYPDKLISIYGSQEEKKETDVMLQTENDGAGSCLPFVPENNRRVISWETLPAPCRNVLEAWNKLPLKKFTGLVPSFLKKLNALLAHYGEAAVRKAVESIGRSPFLLGKKCDWTVTLGWLLEPGNFAKVLSGKYQDRNDGCGSYTGWNNGSGGSGRHNSGSGCEDRQPGERFPFYLPGEGDAPLDEEQTKQGLYEFFHPNDPTREKVAGLLGLFH